MKRISFSNIELNTTITVDNQDVPVNNYVLALSSKYFERNFFDQRYPPTKNIELPPSTTIEDFKRLLAILPPEERPLDDVCIEAVLILADRFALDNVLTMCRNFLLHKSRKTKLFKYRMAHKYGWNDMKEDILQSMTLDDFAGGKNFVENATEFGLLDDDTKAAITAHHAGLVSGSLFILRLPMYISEDEWHSNDQ